MKNTRKKLKRLCRRFLSDVRGTVFILFAMTTPVMLAAVGAGLNFAQHANSELSLQAALDAATLAAADELSSGEENNGAIKRIGRQVFRSNIEATDDFYRTRPVPKFRIDRDNHTVTGEVTAEVDLVVKFFGDIQETKVKALSEAKFGRLNVDLAMTLDVTGSMSGNKIKDLQQAAKDVIQTLISETSGGPLTDGVRIGLVPYSAAVNAGDYVDEVTGIASPSSPCVVERTGVHEFSDVSPNTAPIPQHNRAYCPTAEITPLTRNHGMLISEIAKLKTGGCTAGHIGIAWAYYMLSPHWNNVWPVDSQPKPYDDPETMKVAIIMTDGQFNTYYDGTWNPVCSSEARWKSDAAALELCKAMRRDGIVVYSVAFRAPSSAENLLMECAGTEARFFETDSGAELVAAFNRIASAVGDLRLSR